jgi:hypothetical protein
MSQSGALTGGETFLTLSQRNEEPLECRRIRQGTHGFNFVAGKQDLAASVARRSGLQVRSIFSHRVHFVF